MSTQRNPGQTRETILQAAAREIHHHGYQVASLANILAETGMTKGALYHHFPNKQALGYAVVDEVIRARFEEAWGEPLLAAEDPIDYLVGVIRWKEASFGDDVIRYGCPLNNLAHEMSPEDEGFRERIDGIFQFWVENLAVALRRGQVNGRVRESADAADTALFIVASIQGCIGAAKCSQQREVFASCVNGLVDYLNNLRN